MTSVVILGPFCSQHAAKLLHHQVCITVIKLTNHIRKLRMHTTRAAWLPLADMGATGTVTGGGGGGGGGLGNGCLTSCSPGSRLTFPSFFPAAAGFPIALGAPEEDDRYINPHGTYTALFYKIMSERP